MTFLAATDGRYGFTLVLLGCSAVDLSKAGVFFGMRRQGHRSEADTGACFGLMYEFRGLANKCLTDWSFGMYNTRLNVLYLAGIVPGFKRL